MSHSRVSAASWFARRKLEHPRPDHKPWEGARSLRPPRSRLRRVVSNIEVLSREGEEITAAGNALVFESNPRADTVWATRNEYRLRRESGSLRMVRKKVMLVNNDKPLYTLSFLI